jgi:hypothetical protein
MWRPFGFLTAAKTLQTTPLPKNKPFICSGGVKTTANSQKNSIFFENHKKIVHCICPKTILMQTEDELEGLPPLFRNWEQMYALLIGYLALLIGLFYWFSVAFID